MNKIVLVFVSVLICSKTSQDLDTTCSKASKINLFSNRNRQLHNLSRSLFTCLDIDKNSTRVNKIRVNKLINMADDLIDLTERKFKIYREVQNVTKIEVDNKTINALFNLTEVIEEIFKEEHNFVSNNTFLSNDSFAEFYKAVVSDSNWLEKSLIGWETADNKTNYKNLKRKASLNNFRRKYENIVETRRKHEHGINKIKRTQYDELPFWIAPNDSNRLTRRVFLSVPTKINKYPFLTSIQLMGDFVCAGSIINKKNVLTAASCLQIAYQNPNFLRQSNAFSVRTGSSYATRQGHVVPIIEVHFHPDYDPVYLYNNLALGQLESSLNVMSKGLRRIRIDESRRDFRDGSDLTILGWGDQDNIHTYSGLLSKAHLRAYNYEDCKKIYSARYVTKTHFCAGRSDNFGSEACYRDVGGPAFVNSKLVGVVSFGPPVCGIPHSPTVFTRVGDFAPWIDSVINYTPIFDESVLEPNKADENLKQKVKKPVQPQGPESLTLKLVANVIENIEEKLLNDFKEVEPTPEEFDDDVHFFSTTESITTAADDQIFEPELFFDGYPDDFGGDDDFWQTTPLQDQMLHNPLVNKTIHEHTDQIIVSTTPKPTTTKLTSPVKMEVLEFGGTSTLVPKEQADKIKKYKDIIESYMPESTRFDPNPAGRTNKGKKASLSPFSAFSQPPISEEKEKLFGNVDSSNDMYDLPGSLNSDHEFAHELSFKSLENVLKNFYLSCNEVKKQTIEEDNELYEKRRLPFTKTSEVKKIIRVKNKKTLGNNDKPNFKLRNLEVQMNMQNDKIHLEEIITSINDDGKDRNLAHYQMSDELKYDEDPTRKLLNYVNI